MTIDGDVGLLQRQVQAGVDEGKALAEQHDAALRPLIMDIYMTRAVVEHGATKNIPESWAHRSYYDVVATYGAPRSAPLTLRPPLRRMQKQLCFTNAMELARSSSRWTYVEGYAGGFLVVPHAWVIDEDGTIQDPTWSHGRTGFDTGYYFGVPFATDFMEEHTSLTGYTGVLSSDFRADHLILQRGLDMVDGVAVNYGRPS